MTPPPIISLNSLTPGDDELKGIRHELYHPESPGHYVFKNFLTAAQTEHLRAFWSTLDPLSRHRPYRGKEHIRIGCPNFYSEDERGNQTYFNYFWNPPADELTYSISLKIQILRNQIEGASAYREIYPLAGRAQGCRVVFSRQGEEIVPPHRDWVGKDLDPRRTQLTLFLSENGKDYTGSGFGMENNQGKKFYFGVDVPIQAGDLAIWRYNNLHFANNVASKPGSVGFMRMLYSNELVHARVPLMLDLKARLKESPYIEKSVLPLYRRLRG